MSLCMHVRSVCLPVCQMHHLLTNGKSSARRPPAVQALTHCTTAFDLKFVRYAQSGPVKSKDDSSVSYASAVISCRA